MRLDIDAEHADLEGGAAGAAFDVKLDAGGWSESSCGASEDPPESDAEVSVAGDPGPPRQDGGGSQPQGDHPMPDPPPAVPVEAAIVERAPVALCVLAESAVGPATQDMQSLWDRACDDSLVDEEEHAFLGDPAACRSIANLTTVCERTGKDPRKVKSTMRRLACLSTRLDDIFNSRCLESSTRRGMSSYCSSSRRRCTTWRHCAFGPESRSARFEGPPSWIPSLRQRLRVTWGLVGGRRMFRKTLVRARGGKSSPQRPARTLPIG